MKFLRFTIGLFLMLTLACQAMSAPSLSAIQSRVGKAAKLWEKDPLKAQRQLKAAFSDAISWTRPEFVNSVREKGFYLAVKCYSPELVTETMLAADTYLKLFPKGRYSGKIHIYRAMSAFAVDDYSAAVEALEEARKTSRGRLSHKDQTLFLSGYITAKRNRSAEKFIEGEKLVHPSYKLTKDLRRFQRGNDKIEDLLNKLRAGKISGLAAADKIDKELEHAYFAKKAPKAALLSVAIRDVQKPAYNPVSLEWCGLTGAVKHSISPQLREKKYREFLINHPEAGANEIYSALQNLKNIYTYEMRDHALAQKTLQAMKKIPGFSARAEIDETLTNFVPTDMMTEEGNKFLRTLTQINGLLPYNNGALPIISSNHIDFMLMISDMILGKKADLRISEQRCWSGLSGRLLYQSAVGDKDKAWELFSKIKPELTPQINRMIEDCLMPLYLPIQPGERYFLAGLAAVEKFPGLGTDLIIKSISDEPRMFKSEHGLAVLADVYNHHIAYGEAQSVWKTLSNLHPDSIWLK